MTELTADELPNERIIAIDGTSGSGKSTVARGLGKDLGMHVLETGSLYRAVTLICLENDIDVHDEDAVCVAVEEMDFRYEGEPYLGLRHINADIRAREVAMNVSLVSVHPRVRAMLTQLMRHWIVQHGGGVIEGRDITTVVAPQAKVRVYIDAPEDVRAARRHSDPSDNTENRSQSEIQEVIAFRDNLDSTRTASPLVRADGVPEIDSSLYSAEKIISAIMESFASGEPVLL
ncbi:MAG TPA: (d)CMP kinase [Acidimicrobiia bacterium]|nr:(d)CMP kinase [Acidimicrobiia bacterium]